MFKQLLLLALMVAVTHAFIPKVALPAKKPLTLAARQQQKQTPVFTIGGLTTLQAMTEEEEEEARKLTFMNNQRSSKGRTTDEDGKSNIWAYDRKEEVEVSKGNGIIVVVAAIGIFLAALAYLPQIQFPNYD